MRQSGFNQVVPAKVKVEKKVGDVVKLTYSFQGTGALSYSA